MKRLPEGDDWIYEPKLICRTQSDPAGAAA